MTNGNEPAFAACDPSYLQSGLTKREYFAAMALQGLLAKGTNAMPEVFAKAAVIAADELIKSLNETK